MLGTESLELVKRWIHGERTIDMPDDNETPPPPPPVAMLPEPGHMVKHAGELLPSGESDAERDARIYGEAAVRTAQLRRTIEAEAERNTLLTEELQETLRLLASERKKSGFLELENAELRNNLQVSEADRLAFVETQQRILQAIDRHGVKRPVKKNGKKPEAEKIEAEWKDS
jgi:hypothetical protein